MLNPLAPAFSPVNPTDRSPNGKFDILKLKVVHEAIYAKEVAIAHDINDPSKKYFLKRMGKSCLLKSDADWDRNDAERSLLNGILRCHHLVNYFGCHSDGLDYYVASEYFAEGTLEDYIESDKLINQHVSESLVMHWAVELVKGLFFLHTENIIHKNLKPSNIYIHKKSIKIGDVAFDFSLSNRNLRSLISSASYTSPEILEAIMTLKSSSAKSMSRDLLSQIFSFKSDIWALGCIIYELITYTVAFDDLLSVYEYDKYNMHARVSKVSSVDWNSLLERMLVKNQQGRASTFEVLVKVEALNNNTKCVHADYFDKNLGSLTPADTISKHSGSGSSSKPRALRPTKHSESFESADENNNYAEQPIASTFIENYECEYDMEPPLENCGDLFGNEDEENLVQAYELTYEGHYWLEMGSPDKAVECYDSALNLDQFNFKAMVGKSRALDKLKNTELAWELLNKILSIDKLHMDALVTKGFLALKAKRHDQAIECFSTILGKIDHKCLLALNGKAEAFFCLQKYTECILMFTKALAVSSEDITALLGIANVLYKVGRYQESFDYYTKILLVDERNQDFVLVRVGYLLIETGRLHEAIKYFDRAIAKNPQNHNASIGKTYAQRRLYNSAGSQQSPMMIQSFEQMHLYKPPTPPPPPKPCELKPFDFNF